MAKESVALLESITAEIGSHGRPVVPFAVMTISPGECVTVGPSFNVNGIYSWPDTTVTQCCLMIRPGGNVCVVNPTSLASGRGMFGATFANVPLGDYYLDAEGDGGGQYITDITVAQVGGGSCHRTVRIDKSTHPSKRAESRDAEDETRRGGKTLSLTSLTYELDRSVSPAETLVRLGISTPTLALVTFGFSVPEGQKLKSCTLGELHTHAIEANEGGKWSAAFKNVPLGASVLRVHLDDGGTSSFPVEVVSLASIEAPEKEAAKRAVTV